MVKAMGFVIQAAAGAADEVGVFEERRTDRRAWNGLNCDVCEGCALAVLERGDVGIAEVTDDVSCVWGGNDRDGAIELFQGGGMSVVWQTLGEQNSVNFVGNGFGLGAIALKKPSLIGKN